MLGMFKDEAGGKQIVEFVELRAKLYSYKMLDCSEDKKCKGVTKNVRKRSIRSDDYRECLFSKKEQHRKINDIRSHCHEIYTEELIKLPSHPTMTNELLWQTEYRPCITDIQTKKIVIKK